MLTRSPNSCMKVNFSIALRRWRCPTTGVGGSQVESIKHLADNDVLEARSTWCKEKERKWSGQELRPEGKYEVM